MTNLMIQKITPTLWFSDNAEEAINFYVSVFPHSKINFMKRWSTDLPLPDGLEDRMRYVIDDIIDRGDNLNFMHTHGRGRTGKSSDGNMPWNVIIDLGDYYQLSRIITVQRHSGGLANVSRGQYYRHENVGIYEIYVFNDDTKEWEYVTQNKVEVPVGLSELEMVKKGEAGDMAYMFPDDPKYTKPTRWFRYKAVKGFGGNYTLDDANCLSEITLYGKKASK